MTPANRSVQLNVFISINRISDKLKTGADVDISNVY